MDTKNSVEQRFNINLDQNEYLEIWIEKFLVDRKIEGYTQGTIHFYRCKLALLAQYCGGQSITSIKQIDADTIRGLLLWLEQTGHNPGGRNAVYRASKTFVRWWANETEPENWKDPFNKNSKTGNGTA